MASSLEELLAEEGFKRSRRIARSRSSLQSNPEKLPHYSIRDQERRLSVSEDRIRVERTKSYVSRYRIGDDFLNRDAAQSRRPRDNLAEGEILDEGLKNDIVEKSSRNTKLSKTFDSKTPGHKPRNEIIEVDEQEEDRVKDVYSNELLIANRGKEEYLNDFRNRDKWPRMLLKDAKLDKRHSSSSSTHKVGQLSGSIKKNIKRQERSYSQSTSESFENIYDKNHGHALQTPADVALDEVAVQAVVSILNGYIKRFINDEDFRSTLRHNCFSSLNFIELEDENSTEIKVIRSLEQAIDTIEQAAEESVSEKELKRTSLQLSIITGLSLNELKYGFTCGMPNYKLSACAHLYLSVVYKIQRKDKVSAKHLLQVFCDSPSQARTTLLPELWEYLFSPHLSHLRAWYKREVHMLLDMPSRTRKVKNLEKVYNEHLDSGTYSFAVYYKDWLTEGAEAPSVPSVTIPSISSSESHHGSPLGQSSELASPVDSFSPPTMVSKKLYDSVFGSSSKAGIVEEQDNSIEDNLHNNMKHSCSSSIAEQKLTFVSEMVKYTDEDTEEDSKKMTLAIELHTKETSLLYDLPHERTNEITLSKVSGSVLCMQDAKRHFDPIVSTGSLSSEESVCSSVVNPTETSSSPKGLYFPTIPQEFICPLTGTLFEEPTTLETGQTYERAAIKAWFEKGNRTCPVSGNTIDCVAMPLTNLVLKRLIDNWKSEQFNRILDFASQIADNESHKLKHDEAAVFNLERLFTSLNGSNKRNYVKQLISIGLLSFLFMRLELGNLEEKTHALALLLNCSEADSSCIYQIARNIDKKFLLELLCSDDVAPRTTAISLLAELFSLKRNDAISFLSDFAGPDVLNTMNVLLLFLKNSSLHQKPLVAVLLLHLDLLTEPQTHSIYREEAVNVIAVVLDASLHDDKVQEKCCRALLILEGLFATKGKKQAKTDILKQNEDENNSSEVNAFEHDEEGLISLEDEEEKNKEWLVNLLELLIGDGESPFLKNISRCLASRYLDLVRVCLLTVTWLSSRLSLLSNSGSPLPAFPAIIYQIKGILRSGDLELKTLASLSLFYFSKIPESRALLMTMAEDIAAPLHRLIDVTWTAKQLLVMLGKEL
ncbi:hypothetical protein K1719_009378 [Acacia pycnantha]|nr:hypothetical protein K1719_009378 [Acacia pycnantha]